MPPNSQEIKLNVQSFFPSVGYRYHTCDAEFCLPDPNVQKVIRSLYFDHAGDEKKRHSVQCDGCELLENM